MAYVHRRVKAGRTIEHRKMQSYRIHTKGVQRGPNHGTTSEKQAKVNERVAEEHLRWDLNANFDHRDLHAVLHYYAKDTTFPEILADKAAFLSNLRKICKKRRIKYKAVVVIETKRMTNPHIHVVITRMDPEIITEAWESVPRGGGVSVSNPWTAEATMRSWRITWSKKADPLWRNTGSWGNGESGTARPKTWTSPLLHTPPCLPPPGARSPKASKGAVLYKFDDGSTTRSGWHEISGYPYQEYFEVFNE